MESDHTNTSRIRAVLNRKNPVLWIVPIAIAAAILIAVCLFASPETKPEQAPEPALAPDSDVLEWLDYDNRLETLPWNDTEEIRIDAFPNVTFCWSSSGVSAAENGKEQLLFSGMPVITVCFSDVTGDGIEDVCAVVYDGSGLIDKHIVVYDYANRQGYTLCDRGSRDFHLFVEQGRLRVGVTPYGEYEPTETGTLESENGIPVYRSDAVTSGSGAAVPLQPLTEENATGA